MTSSEPRPNPQPYSLEEARANYVRNARARRTARKTLEEALRERAQGEHDYRKELSKAFAKYRAEGKGVGESEIHARADAAGVALERDLADARAKSAVHRLAELEGERASLRQLGDWGREEGGPGT